MTLIDNLETKRMTQGEIIIQQGDVAENFFILEEGEVECLEKRFGETELKVVRQLKTGDHFGEIALIDEIERTLTIKVKS